MGLGVSSSRPRRSTRTSSACATSSRPPASTPPSSRRCAATATASRSSADALARSAPGCSPRSSSSPSLSAAGLSYYFLTELEGFALRKLEERLDTAGAARRRVPRAAYDRATGPDRRRRAGRARRAALAAVGAEIASRMRVLDARRRRSSPTRPPRRARDRRRATATRPEVRARARRAARRGDPHHRRTGRVALYVAVPDRRADGRDRRRRVRLGDHVLDPHAAARLPAAARRGCIVAFVAGDARAHRAARALARAPAARARAGAAALRRGDHAVRVDARAARARPARVADAFNALADEVETRVDRAARARSGASRASSRTSATSCARRSPRSAAPPRRCIDDDVDPEDAPPVPLDDRRASPTASRGSRTTSSSCSASKAPPASCRCAASTWRASSRRAVEALEPLTEERGVAVDVEGEAPEVLGDLDRIQQVVAQPRRQREPRHARAAARHHA